MKPAELQLPKSEERWEDYMIALDEDMVGTDGDTIIIQGLRLCLGLLCKTGNQLIGAHFTSHDTVQDMNIIMRRIRLWAANNINWMLMAAKFNFWIQSSSGLNSKEKLAAYFRTQLLYPGPMNYIDCSFAPVSYDIKCVNGPQPTLYYRATPNPNPTKLQPLPNVYKLRRSTNELVQTNAGQPGIYHLVPKNTSAGFIMLRDIRVLR